MQDSERWERARLLAPHSPCELCSDNQAAVSRDLLITLTIKDQKIEKSPPLT